MCFKDTQIYEEKGQKRCDSKCILPSLCLKFWLFFVKVRMKNNNFDFQEIKNYQLQTDEKKSKF